MDHNSTKAGRRDRDARVRRTRQQLRESLVELLGTHALADISARMIAERAEVGYATFFRHHPDVDALLTDVAASMIAELTPVLLPLAARGDFRAVAACVTCFVAEHRSTCTALLVGAGERTRNDLLGLAYKATGELSMPARSWLPPALAIAHQISATLTTLTWWLEHDPTHPPDKVGDMIYRLAFEPTAAMLVSDTGDVSDPATGTPV